MARTKAQKKELIEKLEKMIDKAKTLVFVNFHGLKVGEVTEIRRTLKKNGVSFFVAKKSLTKRALASKKFEGTEPELIGEFGMAYSEDLVSPARGIYEFQKKFKEALSIVGGVFENKYKTKEEMIEIASIPSSEVLYGMFVNVINSPIQGFVMALDQIRKRNNNMENNIEIPSKFKTLVDSIEKMSVLELNELVKLLEKKFGVSAQAVAVAAPAQNGAAAAAEEKSTFTAYLTAAGDQKIAVIKVVKELLGLGLKEAKDLVDGAPVQLKADMKKEDAEDLKKQIETAGGKVDLK